MIMNRKLTIPMTIIILCVAWYWFRPERLFVDRHVHEVLPVSGDSPMRVLASGSFHSGTHPTRGLATVYLTANGTHILRFTNFKTYNGPDVHIYMVAADDVRDSASVRNSESIDVGLIKGNIGDQNYVLGSDVNLGKYRTVSVWCKRFSKNFGAAPLISHYNSVKPIALALPFTWLRSVTYKGAPHVKRKTRRPLFNESRRNKV